MANMPISVARSEYMRALLEITNNSQLPYFAMADVLGRMKEQVEKLAEVELQRDMALWKQAQEVTKADDA